MSDSLLRTCTPCGAPRRLPVLHAASCLIVLLSGSIPMVAQVPAAGSRVLGAYVVPGSHEGSERVRIVLKGPDVLPPRMLVYEVSRGLPSGRSSSGRNTPMRWMDASEIGASSTSPGRRVPVWIRAKHPVRLIRSHGGTSVWEATIPASASDSDDPDLLLGIRDESGSERLVPINSPHVAPLTPILGEVSITPNVINGSESDHTVRVQANLKDSGSGLLLVYFYLTLSDTLDGLVGGGELIDGTDKDGTWAGDVYVPRYTTPGTYTLSITTVNNSVTEVTELPTSKTLVITGAGDATAPVVVGTPVVSPSAVDLTSGPKTVTVSFVLTDDVSGTQMAEFDFVQGEDFLSGGPALLVEGDAFNGTWRGVSEIPQNAGVGDWRVRVSAYDVAYNHSDTVTAAVLRIGGADSEVPELVGSVSVLPTSVDVSQVEKTVVVSASFSDDQSGVESVYFDFLLNDESGFGDYAALVSGDSLQGVWRAEVTVPRDAASGAYALMAYVADAASNATEFSLGEPLTVGGGDTEGPVLVGGATLSATQVDLSTGDQVVRATATVGDAASGVGSVEMRLVSDDGSRTIETNAAVLTSGDRSQGVWAADMTIRVWVDPGRYRLRLEASDQAGNYSNPETDAEVEVTIAPPGVVGEPFPEDGSSGVFERPSLEWKASPRATSYAVTVWLASAAEPAIPTVADMSGTRYVPEPLIAGETYRWRVVAKNGAGQTLGPVWSFTVRPLPDLVVSSIQIPPDALSGQTIEVRWTVTNAGLSATSTPSWQDVLYLSADTDLNIRTDTRLGAFENLSYLNPGESYVNVQQVTLPRRQFGPLFVMVYPDQRDDVNETGEDNNLEWSAVQVNLPPTADLQVESFVVPSEAFSGEEVDVNWTVVNRGSGASYADRWSDAVYLSLAPELDARKALGRQAVRKPRPSVQPGEGYTESARLAIPDSVSGILYVFLVLDEADEEFEPGGEDNNRRRVEMQVILSPPADLVPSRIVPPSTGQSGRPITLSWTVENQGLTTTHAAWSDRIYTSATSTFDPSTAKVVGTFPAPRGLEPDSSYSVTAEVHLPDGISGPTYLFVSTDWRRTVFEGPFETNNVAASSPVAVSLSPWPDLRVGSVSMPGELRAGELATLAWRVENAGLGTADRPWTDSVYISPQQTFDRAEARLLGYAERMSALEPGGSYTQTLQTTLPVDLSGTLYAFVRTDASETLYEHTDEGNNAGRSSGLSVESYPPADLAVTELTAPSPMFSGRSVAVQMTVTNVGSGRTLSPFWEDRIYLSTDDRLSPDVDVLVGLVSRQKALGPNERSVRNVTLNIPSELEGARYLVAQTDASEFVDDPDRSNNVRVAGPVTIQPVSPSDLRVETVEAPVDLVAGQPVKIQWSVRNDGPAEASDTLWFDNVTLSPTSYRRQGWLLGSVARLGGLAAGDSYTQQIDVVVPRFATGKHYLIVRTDSRGDVFEKGDRENNEVAFPVNVTLPPPSDLVVADAAPPGQAIVGEEVTISWTLRNQGLHPAVGRTTAGVYVSPDTSWDAGDPLVGLETQDVALDPGESTEVSSKVDLSAPLVLDEAGEVTGRLPGLVPGAYYAIVRADLRNNIPESNETNNTTTSPTTFLADVPVLPLSQLVSSHWDAQNSHFYRVVPGPNVDLRVRLTGAIPFSGGLYVSHESMPSQSRYDFSDVRLDGTVKEVVVPSTVEGSYYVLLQTDHLLTSQDDFSVLAEALSFSVESITPARGGQGLVTTRIRGAGFRPNSRAFLRGSGGNVVEAEVLSVPSTVELVARWDLSGVPLGTYTVSVRNENSSADLTQGFEVEPLRAPTLAVIRNMPERILVDRPTPFILQFHNTSNVDIPLATISLAVPASGSVAVQTDDRLLSRSELLAAAGLTGDSLDYVETDFRRYIPLFARDVIVDERLEVKLIVTPKFVPSAEYPLRIVTQVQDLKTFLTKQLEHFESGRRAILGNPERVDPGWLALAQDPNDFAETLLRGLVQLGLLREADIATGLTLLDAAGKRVQEAGLGGPGVGAGTAALAAGSSVCWEFFSVLSCPLAFLDCAIDIPFVPISGGASAALCGFGIIASCGSAAGADVPFLAGCVGVLSAINCVVSYVVCTYLVFSLDPNDILGPDGYGDRRWVSGAQPLAYTVRFENDPERATAPAQVVRVTLPIDPHLDERTFRLGSFGFGGFTFDVPSNAPSYSGRLDLRDSLGLFVDVNAGVDVQNRQAFWVLRSVDPATNVQPTNPLVGLLAVNDSLGHGDGFVSYTIRPQRTAVTGDTVHAAARIVFDLNEPIDTPPVFNTVDAGLPQSRLSGFTVSPDGNQVELTWNAGDDADGSGVRDFALFSARDNEPFQLVRSGLTGRSVVLPREASNLYRFFVLATDNVGNVEAAKQAAEVVVSTEPEDGELPTAFSLGQNYPNPFNPATTIPFELAQQGEVELTVYDLLGRQVERLDLGRMNPGRYQQRLDLGSFASGIYLYELRVREGRTLQFRATGKLVLVR